MAVDDSGNVYVTGRGNSTIRRLALSGTNWVVTIVLDLKESVGESAFTTVITPLGLAVDGRGNLYVKEAITLLGSVISSGMSIQKVTPERVVTWVGESRWISEADWTSGLATDRTGNLYAANFSAVIKGVPTVSILNSRPGFGFTGGQFGFNLTGPAGQPVVVEASTDLVNWSPIWTNSFAGGLRFSDPQSAEHPARLYRLRSP